jgi:phage gp36-like protein
MYCTKQDMIDRFGEAELAQRTDRINGAVIDDAVLTLKMADAADEIDSYLTQYALPLPSVPNGLVARSCDIARYNLYQNLDLEETSMVRSRYNAAIAWLKLVAKGGVQLGVDDNGSTTDAQTVVVIESPPRLFGRSQR